jgi:hypothetical protein
LDVRLQTLRQIITGCVRALKTGEAAVILFKQEPGMDIHPILEAVLAKRVLPFAFIMGLQTKKFGGIE